MSFKFCKNFFKYDLFKAAVMLAREDRGEITSFSVFIKFFVYTCMVIYSICRYKQSTHVTCYMLRVLFDMVPVKACLFCRSTTQWNVRRAPFMLHGKKKVFFCGVEDEFRSLGAWRKKLPCSLGMQHVSITQHCACQAAFRLISVPFTQPVRGGN